MSKGTTTSNDWMKYTFNATAISWEAVSNLYVALHTATPGVGGNQTTNEAIYGGYARVAVVRTTSGWTVSTNQATNAADILFPTSTGTDNTVTYVSVGTAASGAGQILYFGPITAGTGIITTGITPKFLAGALVLQEAE